MTNPNPTSSPPAATTTLRHSRLWPIAAVAIVFLLLVGLPLAYLLIRAANAPTDILSSATNTLSRLGTPQVTIHTLTLAAVEDLQRQSKLVVLQTTVNVEIEKSESASSWGIYWGTNTARVLAQDVHVQYALDLRSFNTSDVLIDTTKKTMTLSLPKPTLDESMISIDPAKIQTRELTGGWLRWDKADTHSHAIADLRPQAISTAKTPYLQQESERGATEALQKLLRPLQNSLSKENYTLEIHYH